VSEDDIVAPTNSRSVNSTSTNIQTTIDENGSEVPQRLNNKVFIDGLPYTHTPEPGKMSLEEELRMFVQDWKVGKVMKLIKRDGQGFGYLAFRSPNSVDVAVRVLNGRKFLGRPLRVEVPKPKQLEDLDASQSIRDQGKTSFARQVLLSDLAKSSQVDLIREILKDVAPQLEAKIETIKMTSNNRKAFVTLASEDDVEPAVRFLNGFSLLGRNICAQRALAPGSLPFSKATAGAPKAVVASEAPESNALLNRPAPNLAAPASNSRMTFDEEEEADMFVPLGSSAKVASSAEPKGKITEVTSKKLSASTAAVDGKTSKYDLLDKGPSEIYVGNLPEDLTEGQLRKHFSACGNIKTCSLIMNPNSKTSTGIAHIEFTLPAYAKYALDHMHGSRLGGNSIRVDRGEEANPEATTSTVISTNDEDTIDEDGFIKHYGIRNKDAYFRNTSVAETKDVKKETEKASASTTKKSTKSIVTKKRSRAEGSDSDEEIESVPLEPAKPPAKAKRLEKKLTAAAPSSKTTEKAAPVVAAAKKGTFAEDSSDDEEHFFDADDAKQAVAATKSSKKSSATKTKSSSRKGTVEF